MNDDDQLLRDLGRLAKAQKEREMMLLDRRWDALSEGALDPEDEAELEALASTSEQMKEAWEAFRPLDATSRGRILDRVRSLLPRSSPIPWWSLAAASLLVAVLGLWFAGLPKDGLPTYSLEARGGLMSHRSDVSAAGPPRLVDDVRLDLELFPATPVEGDVALAVFLEQGGTLRPWGVPAQSVRVAPSGAFRLEVRARDLELGPGPATLWLAVSRPGSTPEAAEIQDLIRGDKVGGATGIQVLRQDVWLEAAAPEVAP